MLGVDPFISNKAPSKISLGGDVLFKEEPAFFISKEGVDCSSGLRACVAKKIPNTSPLGTVLMRPPVTYSPSLSYS